MPQICTEGNPSPVLPGTSTYEMASFGRSEGRLGGDGSTIALRNNSQGVIAGLAKVFSRTEAPRRTPEAENKHIAALPKVATDKILAYLADPFERATLAMTCRLLYRQLKPYWPEFQLFRDLIASKKSLDFRAQSACMKDVTLLLDLLTGDRWTSWRARSAFVDTIRRVGNMYPNVPERIFHEVWPLFRKLTRNAKLELLQEAFHLAMERSPNWAITVLTEFARRTTYSAKADFHDKLLDLTVPLLRNANTAKACEPLLAAIAQRWDPESRARDEARWKRILQLVPPSTSLNSEAVVGLANTAIRIQRRWAKCGQKQGQSFPAVTMMRNWFNGFPSDSAICAYALRFSAPEEMAIDNRRLQRYVDSPRYESDCARRERLHREIVGTMYARNVAPWCETAGGS